MQCEQARRFLESLAAGRLESREEADVREHLKTCPACGRELRWIEALKTSVRSIPRPSMPADLREDLLRLGDRRTGFQRWLPERRSWRWAMGFGFASAFAAAAAFLVFRNPLQGAGEEIGLDEVLVAHSRYELTMPAADREAIYSNLGGPSAPGGHSDEI